MTDDVFRDTETSLSTLPLKLSQPIGAFIQRAKSEVHIGRTELESGLDRPYSPERLATTTAVFSRFVAAGGLIDEALLGAERAVTEREPRVGLIIKNPRVANEMREAAGQRSTILSRFAGTGIRLDDDARDKVSELTGAVHLAWGRLRRLSSQPGNAPIRRSYALTASDMYPLARSARRPEVRQHLWPAAEIVYEEFS
jgi:hypothetical protein